MPNKAAKRHPIQFALKRLVDILASATGLVLLSPVMGAMAVAIKLDSPGPVFFRHCRIGQGGKPFSLLKFRSMVSGGDDREYMQYLRQLIESERGSDGGQPYRKMENDPRVTRVGQLLRRYYLDELPQLWNILRGDMSLVGPRPHVQFEVDHYTEQQQRRLTVKPGCTGLWQVEGKADCTFSQLIDLDLRYIDHWSLWVDVKVMAQTAWRMVRGGEGVWARAAKQVPEDGTEPKEPGV